MTKHHTELKIFNTRTHLAGSLFHSHHSSTQAVIIAPATGIKRQFYQAFAMYLAKQGYTVLTFNDEGIGDSGRCQDTSLVTWGEYDVTAVIREMSSRYPNHKLHWIGHSAGGLLFGLSPQYHRLASVFSVGASSGSLAGMKAVYRLKAKFFLNMLLPMSAWVFGVGRSDWVGMGEPLPRLVAQQWRDWCNASGYVASAFGKTVTEHYYDKLNMPALWLYASDDDIATTHNVQEMATVFSNMDKRIQMLKPNDFGLSEIGHMKFFSRKSTGLWVLATQWLQQHH